MNYKVAEHIVMYRLDNTIDSNIRKNVGYMIKKERLRRNLRLADVADGICSLSYLSKIENNAIDPKDQIVETICGKLDISPYNPEMSHRIGIKLLKSILKHIEFKNDQQIEHDFREIESVTPIDDDYISQLIKLSYYNYKKEINQSKQLIKLLFKLQSHFTNYELFIFYEQIGTYNLLIKQYEDASIYLELSYKLMNKLGIQKSLLLYKFAWVHYVMNNKYKSYIFAQKASNLFYDVNNFYRKIQADILIAVNLAQEDYYLSRNKYLNLINSTQQLNFKKLHYICNYNLGLLNLDYQKYNEALNIFICLYNKSSKQSIDCLIKIIELHIKIKDYDKAKGYLHELKTSIKQDSSKKDLYKQYFDIIMNEFKGDHILKFYKNTALPYARKEKNTKLEIKFLQERANLYERENRYKDALLDYKKIIGKVGI